MTDGQVISFKFGEGFPADSRLARWVTAFAMAVNDLLLVNRWLVERLSEDSGKAYENLYLARLVSAHLYEIATFLKRSDRDDLPEVRQFIADLDEAAQRAHEQLKEIGEGGTGDFAKQIKVARNKVFHYSQLVLGEGSEIHDPIGKVLKALSEKEEKKGLVLGKIEDIKPPIKGFRAIFADDVAVNLSFPTGDEEEDAEEGKEMAAYLSALLKHVLDFIPLAQAILLAYTKTRPEGTWHVEDPGHS
jgi:hypothetical protein